MKLRPVVRPAQPSGAAAIAACWGALLLCLCLALLFTARSPGQDTPSAPSMVPEARAALLAQLSENAQRLLNRKPTPWQRENA